MGTVNARAADGTRIGTGKARRSLGHIAAVEEFALQNFPQTRAKSDGFKAAMCTARLVPNFHHKHVQPPLPYYQILCFCELGFASQL